MASWNSVQLEVLYIVLGWVAFVSWSISFYPQVILNFRRKSVVGLNFDFILLNLTKHSSYLIYNASLFFSSAVRRQYHEKFGFNEMIPVAANDVAFSMHAVLLTAFTLFQIAIYDRGNQKFSKISVGIVSVAWLFAAVCVCIAMPKHSWLWLVSCFNDIQVVMTIIKYIPQAILNFRRKSTIGFSIGNILLDFLGGVTNYCQMAVQSIDQNSWVNFYGNIGKTMISLVSIFFDILFIIQHYVLYRPEKNNILSDPNALCSQRNTEMKREGRQHGMVRTYPIVSAPYNPRPKPRNLNELSSPPTAGLFTKVSSKPTNHSKFTGKCGRPKCRDCHVDPACKSKVKAKGAHKTRRSPPSDVGSITWGVEGPSGGPKVAGLSATGVLGYLDSDDCYVDGYDYLR